MRSNKTTIGAVITGDIVNSTELLPKQEKALFDRLRNSYLVDHPYEFYRGDSFQVFIDKSERALSLALACRALAISLEETTLPFDIRVSIGIGKVNLPIVNMGMSKGEAFVLSGRKLDTLKEEGRRLAIVSGDDKADIGFDILSDYIDSIFKKMTARQASVIIELLNGVSQQQLAGTLNKSKSTISEVAAAGRWPEVERLLHQYEKLVKLIV